MQITIRALVIGLGLGVLFSIVTMKLNLQVSDCQSLCQSLLQAYDAVIQVIISMSLQHYAHETFVLALD